MYIKNEIFMSKKKHIAFISEILQEVYKKRKPGFSGIGIAMYDDIELLPTSPLREDSMISPAISECSEIINFLSTISNKSNKYHDGFHFISSNLELTHVCQYFSPPVVEELDLNFKYGGRYRAGLYGSALDSVLACGVASNNYKPTIFVNGEIINSEFDER